MKTIAIANHKGGCGKTTTAHNLVMYLTGVGSVLALDLEPQASLTEVLGQKPSDAMTRLLYNKQTLNQVVMHLDNDIDLVAADYSLASLNAEMGSGWESHLASALRKADYEVCVIDCPPGLGMLTANALFAADGVLIPALPSALDIRGLVHFIRTINVVRRHRGGKPDVIGVLVTQYHPDHLNDRDVLAALQASELPTLDIQIGDHTVVKQAAAARKPLWEYDPSHKVTHQYNQLGLRIGQWLNNGAR